MSHMNRLGQGLELLVYPVIVVLLFWPAVFFQVTTHETFKVSSEFAVVVVSWVTVALVAAARAMAGLPFLGGGSGSLARRFGIALLVWIVVSTLLAYNPESSWSYGLTAIAYLLLGQSLLGWVEMRPARRRFVFGAVLALGLWQVFWGFLQWFKLPLIQWGTQAPVWTNGPFLVPGGFWLHDYLLAMGAAVRQSSVMGSLGNVNYFAEFVGLLLPVGIGAALAAKRPWVRGLAWLAIAASAFLLVAAGARAVLLGLLVGAIVAAAATFGAKALDPRRWWASKQGKIAMGVVGVVLVLAAVVTGDRLATKLGSAGSGADNSIASRLINWKSSLHLVAKDPITGMGPGGYKLTNVAQLRQDYPEGLPEAGAMTRFMQTHSEPLQTLIELGVVGLAFAFLGVLAWGREVSTNPTLSMPMRFGLLWGASGFLIGSIFAFPLHLPLTALVFTVLVAMGMVRDEAEEPEALPLIWRPVYALGVLVVTGLTALLAIGHGVGPLFHGHRYEYAANQLTAKQDYAQAEIVLALADRNARYRGSIRWNWLKILVLQKKYDEAIALHRASEKWGIGMDSHYWLARALHLSGRTGEARTAYLELMNYYPPTHSLHKRAASLISKL